MLKNRDRRPVLSLPPDALIRPHGPAPVWRGDNIAGVMQIGPGIALKARRATAAEPALLRGLDPIECLTAGFVPWRRVGATTVVATDGRSPLETILEKLPGRDGRVVFAPASQREVQKAIQSLFAPRLAARARNRTDEAFSCRGWMDAPLYRLWPLLALGVLALGLAAPYFLLGGLLLWISLVNFATMAVRATALIESLRARPAPPPKGVIPISHGRKLPRVSILLPLLREDVVLRHLIANLARTTYPKDLLDVKLVVEPDDFATQLALAQIDLPAWITVLITPPDTLRTKPRALNFALDFCTGDIVGIYDAEDRPEPEQVMKIVRHFQAAPAEVGCVQGYLDFYNSRQNWLSRCFTLEYAIWFRVLLGGIQRLGLPIPLGGTTVFFRRQALEKVGAWDAHNVTEDADLGMRLARFGLRTEMVATTTMEEANCHPRAWVKQRSRWLKGYAITWATHMRAPRRLYRDLGAAGFLGFQVLFLGGLTSYLATPLFWLLWAGTFGVDLALWQMLPEALWLGFFASMAIGQLLMLAVACRAAAAPARRHLLITIPTLVLYWPLGALAAYRALHELFRAPFYWDKTQHGL